MGNKTASPHLLIVEARFYDDMSDALLDGEPPRVVGELAGELSGGGLVSFDERDLTTMTYGLRADLAVSEATSILRIRLISGGSALRWCVSDWVLTWLSGSSALGSGPWMRSDCRMFVAR